MRPPVLLGLLLLAGCVAPSPGENEVSTGAKCADLCDLLATVDPETRQANELSIAVNPRDALNILATGKDYTPDEAGDCVWAGIYTTKDGGKTWKNQNVPGSPWKRLEDPTAPETIFTRYWCATDPVVAFGADGRAYWTVMPYQCDPATGSKSGRGIIPGSPLTGGGGGLNDWAWSCSAMAVLTSDDGGDTWPIENARILVEGARLVHDKQWLAVSPAGDTVLLCWDYSNAVEQSTGVPPPPADDPLAATHPTTVVCSKSTDRGDTWSEMAVASERGAYPWIDFDARGHAWMVLTDGFEEGEMLVLHSEDGVSWSEPVAIGNFTNGPETNDHGWPTLRGSAFRVVPVGSLAVDRSAGPHGGRVYVTWFDHGAAQRAADAAADADASSTNESGDVLLAWSDDGMTWSAPRVVHDDVVGAAGGQDVARAPADQFMPVVSVGPDGTVDVSWQDRRDDPNNHLFHTYYAYSLDGGVTFSANLRVSAVASDEAHSHHQNGMIFLGDYRDSDSAVPGQTSMVWVDTRDGKADVRVATLTRPQANGG